MLKRVYGALVVLMMCLTAAAASAALPDFTHLIEENSPAVVKIHAVERVPGRSFSPPDHQDVPEFFRRFFEQYEVPERQAQSMGSGFIISRDGYIVTNHHVVGDAQQISVQLIDRREFAAEVVGADQRSDLALLKIEATDLPVAKLGKADDLKVGEWVVAIGSPFGLDYSASAGIVSAIGRSLPNQRGENYVPFIQSDVAINPGNSGGPLFNMRGEVVGINSQIYTRTGGSIGLSFAIPVGVAYDVIQQLKEKGRVDRGWLGVYIQDVDRDLARSLGLNRSQGALIAQVEPGSPAHRAGFRAGDVILAFNGRTLAESAELPHVVGLLAPGTETAAVVFRDGKEQTLKVTVGGIPGDAAQVAQTDKTDRNGGRAGVDVAPVDAETLAALNLESGVVVTQVYPGTPASEAGLVVGDIIVEVVGFPAPTSPAEFAEIEAKLPTGKPVAVRFYHRGRALFRTLQIDP